MPYRTLFSVSYESGGDSWHRNNVYRTILEAVRFQRIQKPAKILVSGQM